MSVCEHTGISIPECSCVPCLRAQLEQHMPALLESDPGGQSAVEGIASGAVGDQQAA